MNSDWGKGYDAGTTAMLKSIYSAELLATTREHARILKRLMDYFELTRFSETHEGATTNPEWDAGFQAAIALVKSRL
jgi:hypothetical protein